MTRTCQNRSKKTGRFVKRGGNGTVRSCFKRRGMRARAAGYYLLDTRDGRPTKRYSSYERALKALAKMHKIAACDIDTTMRDAYGDTVCLFGEEPFEEDRAEVPYYAPRIVKE